MGADFGHGIHLFPPLPKWDPLSPLPGCSHGSRIPFVPQFPWFGKRCSSHDSRERRSGVIPRPSHAVSASGMLHPGFHSFLAHLGAPPDPSGCAAGGRGWMGLGSGRESLCQARGSRKTRGMRKIQPGAGRRLLIPFGQGSKASPEALEKGGKLFPMDFGTELQPGTFQAWNSRSTCLESILSHPRAGQGPG